MNNYNIVILVLSVIYLVVIAIRDVIKYGKTGYGILYYMILGIIVIVDILLLNLQSNLFDIILCFSIPIIGLGLKYLEVLYPHFFMHCRGRTFSFDELVELYSCTEHTKEDIDIYKKKKKKQFLIHAIIVLIINYRSLISNCYS